MAKSIEETDQYRAELLETHDKVEALERNLKATWTKGQEQLMMVQDQLTKQEEELSRILEESAT